MKRPKKVLLLGAGGMGMAPLALYLKGAGVRVEAYDDCFCEPNRGHLIKCGVRFLTNLIPLKNRTALYIPLRLSTMIHGSKNLRIWKFPFIAW